MQRKDSSLFLQESDVNVECASRELSLSPVKDSRQPRLVCYRDEMAQRMHMLKKVEDFDPWEAEITMVGKSSLLEKLKVPRLSTKATKERAARLQELINFCATGGTTQTGNVLFVQGKQYRPFSDQYLGQIEPLTLRDPFKCFSQRFGLAVFFPPNKKVTRFIFECNNEHFRQILCHTLRFFDCAYPVKAIETQRVMREVDIFFILFLLCASVGVQHE